MVMMKMSEQQTTVEAKSQPLVPCLPEKDKRSCIFYKLIVPSILQDKKLRIPYKFVKKFGDELSTIVKLIIPNGRIWLVELRKLDNKFWFDIGWSEFVEHCSIRAGYFLIFGYQGNSDFNVYIFDLANSEIEYPHNIVSTLEEPSGSKHCSVTIEIDKEKDKSDRISPPLSSLCPDPFPSTFKVVDEGASYKMNKNSVPRVKFEYLHLPKQVHNQDMEFQSPLDKGTQFSSKSTDTSAEVGLNLKSGTKRKISGKGPITDSGAVLALQTHSRRWRDVTSEEKKSAFRAAEMFKSDNPFFKIVLRPSYVYKKTNLHIPSSFARTYLNGSKGDITLVDPNGKHWPVRYISQNCKAKISRGWSVFVKESNLDESDVVVFELIKNDDVMLKVTFFRVLEDTGTECQPSKKNHLVN